MFEMYPALQEVVRRAKIYFIAGADVRIGAGPLGGAGFFPSKSALWSLAVWVGHLEAAPVESKTRNDLDRRQTSLGHHRQGVLCLSLVYMAAETVSERTTRAGAWC
jgi:hypothetical protein